MSLLSVIGRKTCGFEKERDRELLKGTEVVERVFEVGVACCVVGKKIKRVG